MQALLAPPRQAAGPRPQSGPQERFLRSRADIAIYGGSAGSGKTWAMLLEPLYHISNPNFVNVIFRRNYTQITNAGGLWDESLNLYPQIGSRALLGDHKHTFPSGARVEFAHLQHVTSVSSWQGSQIPLISFDELTHFEESQFFYMLSRNRSMSGVRPYVRATCNPDADSWVARFIAWWIDEKTGIPIPSRSGSIRWMVRVAGTIHWGDTRAELVARYGRRDLPEDHEEQVRPKSVTFIGASIFDNPALLKKDPEYLGNLQALPLVERERLLGGNWKIRKTSGLLFKRHWCKVVEALPAVKIDWVRYWDLAATEESEGNDPDWTVGLKMGRYRTGEGTYRFVVAAREKMRETPFRVETAILNTAAADGRACRVGLPQDPGQAGKAQAKRFAALLVGYPQSITLESGDKVTRFEPFSAQAEAGNVDLLRGPWNEDFCDALEGFPDAAHDDDADAVSGAFNRLLMAPRYDYAGQVTTSVGKFGVPT